MSIPIPQNYFRETITRAVTLTGATNIYLSAHPTPDEGYLHISPASTSLREIIYYTAKGTDGNGTYVTVTLANRGLGGTTAQTHAIGEPVRMNVGAETIEDISDALDQIVAAGAQDASTSTKGIAKMSVAPASATNPIAVGDNDPRVPTADPTTIFEVKRKGGDGSDGPLTITSGATNIDLGSAQVVIKNYTTVSITGTGSLTFTNPHANGTTFIMNCSSFTCTSSTNPAIVGNNIGGVGGTSPTTSSNNTSVAANAGSDGYGFATYKTNKGSGTTGGATPTADFVSFVKSFYTGDYSFCVPGAGGSSGAVQTFNNGGNLTTGGSGGRGGGAIIINCSGAWNVTSTITVGGGTGGNGSSAGAEHTAGGGGGGGGGTFIGFYGSLTADSGTYTVAGGAGGTASDNASASNKGGGGGGATKTAGSNAGGTNARNGGAGGNGFYLVGKNTAFTV